MLVALASWMRGKRLKENHRKTFSLKCHLHWVNRKCQHERLEHFDLLYLLCGSMNVEKRHTNNFVIRHLSDNSVSHALLVLIDRMVLN